MLYKNERGRIYGSTKDRKLLVGFRNFVVYLLTFSTQCVPHVVQIGCFENCFVVKFFICAISRSTRNL